MLRGRVWADLYTHSLPGWCSGRTLLWRPPIPLALLSLDATNLALLSLGMLLFISSLAVRTWSSCVFMT